MARFTGKIVLITGGTSGIGKVAALAFAREGAKVVLSGRREKEGSAVVAEIANAGGTAHFIQADVAIESEMKKLVEETVKKYSKLDVAFNNAGVEWLGAFTDITEADYRKIFDINVWGVIASMKYEIAAMLKTGGGSIINTSSVAGHVGMAGASVYIASKHAVEGITRSAALEYAKQKIRINSVAPAAIVTDMIERFVGGEDSEAGKGLAAMHPIGRMGQSHEVADAVLYLASDAASFTTGISLPVDGGFLAQ